MNKTEMIEELGKSLTAKRFEHCLAVARRARFLAELYHADADNAELAGLLHDCARELDFSEQLNIIDARGIMLDDFTAWLPHLWHQLAGGVLAETKFSVADKDVIKAIMRHTTGAANMSTLEQVVYLADYTSDDRDYPDVKAIRELSEQSLTLAMLATLEYTIDMLVKQKKPIVKETFEAYNYFWRLNKEQNI